MRIDPPRSLPSARATIPQATAAALPPDDPPAESRGFHGLRVAPKRRFSVTGRSPSSGVFVFPTTIAPDWRSRRTCALSWSATQSPNAALPSLVGKPVVAERRSLIPTGMPQSGRWSPGWTASASPSARSAQTATNAFTCGLRRSIVRSDASTSSRAESSPVRTSRACSMALSLRTSASSIGRQSRRAMENHGIASSLPGARCEPSLHRCNSVRMRAGTRSPCCRRRTACRPRDYLGAAFLGHAAPAGSIFIPLRPYHHGIRDGAFDGRVLPCNTAGVAVLRL